MTEATISARAAGRGEGSRWRRAIDWTVFGTGAVSLAAALAMTALSLTLPADERAEIPAAIAEQPAG
jgi:hypothetical protein